MLHLAAVGVVDHVLEVDACRRRGPHAEDLVGPDPEVAVSQPAVLGTGEAEAAAGLVKHDEVIARALHLGEADSHGGIIRQP